MTYDEPDVYHYIQTQGFVHSFRSFSHAPNLLRIYELSKANIRIVAHTSKIKSFQTSNEHTKLPGPPLGLRIVQLEALTHIYGSQEPRVETKHPPRK